MRVPTFLPHPAALALGLAAMCAASTAEAGGSRSALARMDPYEIAHCGEMETWLGSYIRAVGGEDPLGVRTGVKGLVMGLLTRFGDAAGVYPFIHEHDRRSAQSLDELVPNAESVAVMQDLIADDPDWIAEVRAEYLEGYAACLEQAGGASGADPLLRAAQARPVPDGADEAAPPTLAAAALPDPAGTQTEARTETQTPAAAGAALPVPAPRPALALVAPGLPGQRQDAPEPRAASLIATGDFIPVARMGDERLAACAKAELDLITTDIGLGRRAAPEAPPETFLDGIKRKLFGDRSREEAGTGDPRTDEAFFLREQSRRTGAPMPDLRPGSPDFAGLRRDARGNPQVFGYLDMLNARSADARRDCVAALQTGLDQPFVAASQIPAGTGLQTLPRVVRNAVPRAEGVRVFGPLTRRRAPGAPVPVSRK